MGGGLVPPEYMCPLGGTKNLPRLLIPQLNYYSEEELQLRLETPGQYRVKREPVTALTLTVLLGLGAIGTGSGIAA